MALSFKNFVVLPALRQVLYRAEKCSSGREVEYREKSRDGSKPLPLYSTGMLVFSAPIQTHLHLSWSERWRIFGQRNMPRIVQHKIKDTMNR
jgi:hypothetical protein